MPNKMKVVCPKCSAKLKFDPEKISAEVVKFKCPGCGSVLRLRKPVPGAKKTDASGSPPKHPTDEGVGDAGAELMELAQKFEDEMGFGAPGGDTSSEDVGHVAPVAGAGVESVPEIHDEIEEKPVKAGDARKEKRVKFKKKVLVNNQIMVEALDISENGLFLHTGRSFDDGATVVVGIPTQPGNFDLVVQAVVRHNHRGIGMGLQFIELENEQKVQLKKLISELDQAAAQETEGRKTVLLVGGTDTARNINKSKLVLEGFYVLQATTADEVFRILKEQPPDAMVLEWQETKFNCKGLLARITDVPEYETIIRIVLSALTDSQIQKEILHAGAHRYMAKMDTNPAKLALVIKQLISERDG